MNSLTKFKIMYNIEDMTDDDYEAFESMAESIEASWDDYCAGLAS